MQEFLWEIWIGKRNMHQRTQMDLNETPSAVFQRIVQELQGTENEIKTRTTDPNTGREVEVKWKFSFRRKGETSPLNEAQSFASQGVSEGSLLVVRPVEIRANTIYVDGIEGLVSEEISAAKNRTPLIIALTLLLLIGGLLGTYFLYWLPLEQSRAPYMLKVKTLPKSTTVTMVFDVSQIKDYKKKFKIKSRYIQRIGLTTLKNRYTVMIPKKAKIVFVELAQKGYVSWTKGVPLKTFEKEPGKHQTMDPKVVVAEGFFPQSLKAIPPKPKMKKVPGSKPTAVAVKYPRRWRGLKLAVDPMRGGDDKGPVGVMGLPGSKLNLILAASVVKHLAGQKRRRYRLALSRRKDENRDTKRVLRNTRRSKVLLQIDVADGLAEMPKNVETVKKEGKEIKVNDGISGFQILWSASNGSAAKSKKLATCLGTWLKKAGFIPRAARKGEKMTSAELGIRPVSGDAPVLSGRTPAVRVVAGYLTHREEEMALLQPANHGHFAKAIEGALICYKAR